MMPRVDCTAYTHAFKLKEMQGPRGPFVYTCGLTKQKKEQLKQNVGSVQLMQGWLVLYARPQRGGGRLGGGGGGCSKGFWGERGGFGVNRICSVGFRGR